MRCIFAFFLSLFVVSNCNAALMITVNKPDIKYAFAWENVWRNVEDNQFEYDETHEYLGWFLLWDITPPVIEGTPFPITIHNRKGLWATNNYEFRADTEITLGEVIPDGEKSLQLVSYSSVHGTDVVPVKVIMFRVPEPRTFMLGFVGLVAIFVMRRNS